VATTDKPPKPSIIDCRAGGARSTLACRRAAGRWLSLTPVVATDYLSPASFSVNLLKCMSNDWQLNAVELLRILIPSSARLSGSAAGVEVSLDYLKRELAQEPTPLSTIMDAYSKFAKEAKQKRAPGDPWPVIIIDEANRLTAWKDKESLEQLLAFFVYLTKQEQLAHVVLATSDTFLVEWLESGVLLSDSLFRRHSSSHAVPPRNAQVR
jgi:ATPase domain predominantly from Archaea